MAKPQVIRRPDILGSVWRFGPLRALWWLFSNVRWAMGLMAFIAAVSLLGVLLPQIPIFMRGNPAAEAGWVEFQQDKFGPFTDPMHRIGLFDIFHARWFVVSMGLMITSTAVYIISRMPGMWLSITQPRKRVPDRYFELAPHRFDFPTAAPAGALAAQLRDKRYRVEVFPEPEATYLFADRFAWAQLGTLLTHGAIILFILAAVVSQASSFSTQLFVGEGSSAPVFPVVSHPRQMQVQVLDAVGVFGEDGLPVDYRSELAIYQNGQEVKRCVSTVNSPCGYNGYRFHQAGYYGFGAELQVRDLSTGDIIYRETISLSDQRSAAHIIVRDAASGAVLLDDAPVLGQAVTTQTAEGPIVAALSSIELDGKRFIIGLRNQASGGEKGWTLLVLAAGNPAGGGLQLRTGEKTMLGDLEFEFPSVVGIPALVRNDIPLPPGAPAGNEVLLQMSNVYVGTGNASEGTPVDAPIHPGEPTLTLLGVADSALVMRPGETTTIGGYEYAFVGQKEFAGLEVKKDSSDNLVWVAAALLLGGLLISFWVPRRRLWARITADRTHLVGQTSQMANLRREMQDLAAATGADVEESEE